MKTDLTETQVQRQILDYLEAKQIFHWRQNTGTLKRVSFGQVGSPDIFAVQMLTFDWLDSAGQIYGIEVKGYRGVHSAEQKEWQKRFEAAGGIYILAYSLDDVMGVLDG